MEERVMRIQVSFLGFLLGWFAFSSSALCGALSYPARPGELVVKLSSERSTGAFDRILGRLNRQVASRRKISIRKSSTSTQFATFLMPPESVKEAMAQLKRDPEVAYAEPNYIYHVLGQLDAIPNDPQFGSLWGMKNSGQADAAGQVGHEGSDIHVTQLWSEGVVGSRSIRVAVIDTGVDDGHPDLKANVDAESGYNFVTHTPHGLDDHNHGTHCAGTIGALANNSTGVAGVNWNVSVIPIKFLDAQGSGTLENAVQAIQYATKLKVNIMSNSWGGGPYTQALYDAIEDARKQGILFVAAAGNDSNNNDERATYPATYALDNILSVAATDNQDRLAGFSNYGSKTVHVAAPGVKILSTLKGGAYGVMSGTSMATPHVAGIAALLLSTRPSMSYSDLKDLIMRSSDPVRSLSKKVISRGRVNVHNAAHGIFPVTQEPDESQWKDVPLSLESPHPYENGKVLHFPIKVLGAKYIRVVFDQVDTESGYDFIEVKQSHGEVVDSVSGSQKAYVSDYFEGEAGEVAFTADSSVNKWGFKVSKVQAIY